MTQTYRYASIVICIASSTLAQAASPLEDVLSRPILETNTTQRETIRLVAPKVPTMPECGSLEEWEARAEQIRIDVLNKIMLRGVPDSWVEGPVNVEMLDPIQGGPGYRMQKLRYEAVPGFWIPAILYLPENLEGKVPVFMNVNGHDGKGKQANYKQIRCINQARRGIIALNVEWIRMGQLNMPENGHGRLNQLDLCGISGLAPFYLSMKRGLDVLISLENADPSRVGVAGLSGGGWQTIVISSLDTRVTLSNPVAGYSSLSTRLQTFADLGDSEQTPSDLALYADYKQLTGLLAPRPALLTYNAQDNCCFVSATALPPLLEAAQPIYRLYGKTDHLTSHVNADPGTHNFLQENREALYGLIGRAFFPGDDTYSSVEIPCGDDIKTPEELHVPLPDDNATLNSLAITATNGLPIASEPPTAPAALAKWQQDRRELLRDLVQFREYTVDPESTSTEEVDRTRITRWLLRCDDKWTVPVVELSRGDVNETVILISSDGRASLAEAIEQQLSKGKRVLVPDLWYCGECHPRERDYLFALILQTVGERPVGVQASQLAVIARWRSQGFEGSRISVHAHGPFMTQPALIAAALEPTAIKSTHLFDGQESLKQPIQEDVSFEKGVNQYTFGLLQHFDIPQLEVLAPKDSIVRR
ncbi:MAG: acetylxylan esterase [Planctomycetaceae bacterium]|nr:acetylxylan esterase [Planctomycetaceae bacterium]